MSEFEIRPRCLIPLRGCRRLGRTMPLVGESPHREEVGDPLHGVGPSGDPAETPPHVPDSAASGAAEVSLESHAVNEDSSATGRGPPIVPRSTLPLEFYRGRAWARLIGSRRRRSGIPPAAAVVVAEVITCAGFVSLAGVADGSRM